MQEHERWIEVRALQETAPLHLGRALSWQPGSLQTDREQWDNEQWQEVSSVQEAAPALKEPSLGCWAVCKQWEK